MKSSEINQFFFLSQSFDTPTVCFQFLGKWYVMQKTSTGSRCLLYNFTASSEPNEYDLEQVSEHPVLGLASVDNKYHYTGHLVVPSSDTPAKMTVKFPLSK